MNGEHELIPMKEAAALVGVSTQCAFGWHWRHVLHAEKAKDGRVYTTPQEIRRAAAIMARDYRGRKRLGERAKEITVEPHRQLVTAG